MTSWCGLRMGRNDQPLETVFARVKEKRLKLNPKKSKQLRRYDGIQTLYHRDVSADIRLYTDASKYGIGAYLCQNVINS